MGHLRTPIGGVRAAGCGLLLVVVAVLGVLVVTSKRSADQAERRATRAEQALDAERQYVSDLIEGRAELIAERDVIEAASTGDRIEIEALRDRLATIKPLVYDADECVAQLDDLFQAALRRSAPTSARYAELLFLCESAIGGLVAEVSK